MQVTAVHAAGHSQHCCQVFGSIAATAATFLLQNYPAFAMAYPAAAAAATAGTGAETAVLLTLLPPLLLLPEQNY
jgi:hypothetical protein